MQVGSNDEHIEYEKEIKIITHSQCETTNYEIISTISSRVPRDFTNI